MTKLPESWVDEHGDAMFRYAMRRVGDREVAQDLMQEAFLAALRGREGFRGESALRTWLIGILRLKIVDYFRRRSRERAREQALEDSPAQARKHAIGRWKFNPERVFENDEFWRTFRTCLDKLPELLASAYVLRELDDLPTESICETLNITSTNLSVRVYRARAALRECLDENWFRSEPRDPPTP